MDKNKTHIYNVLARLVSQDVLRKSGKRYYFVPLKDETPSEPKPDGVSKDSVEGSASSEASHEARGSFAAEG